MNSRSVVATTEEGLSSSGLGNESRKTSTSDARVHLQKPAKEVSIRTRTDKTKEWI